MKIALIGSGIAGLTAAYKLRHEHQVTLFEANDTLGGHTNTVDVELDGERHAIDTGFIVFNDRTYPNFTRLLDELGVASRPTSMSFSVRCEASGIEYNGTSLNGLFAQRRNLVRPRFHRLLREIMRFHRVAGQFHSEPACVARDETVEQFLATHAFSSDFRTLYFLPMGAAIWSCPPGTFARFPIDFVAAFFHNHGLLSVNDRPVWRVIDGGSRTYVEAMRRQMQPQVRIRVGTPVECVRRFPDRVELAARGSAPEVYEHVVFACHSDQALRMLFDPSPVENNVLGAIPYQPNLAILHTDCSLLPRRRRAWASWNSFIPSDDANGATITYCMNILQHLKSRHVFNVSLNADDRIDPARILRRLHYAHPVFTSAGAAAKLRHAELIDSNRTSYCGAYWRNGFHEDGVVSALTVCAALTNRPHTGISGRCEEIRRPLPAGVTR